MNKRKIIGYTLTGIISFASLMGVSSAAKTKSAQTEYAQGNYKITYTPNDSKIFNAGSTLCASSGGSTAFGWGDYSTREASSNKTYGAIEIARTHPGGHYTVSFTFDASISMTYLSQEECSFAIVDGTSRRISCGEADASPMTINYAAPSFGSAWSSHPDTVTLYDSTDSQSPYANLYPNTMQALGATGIGATKVTMTYRHLGGGGSIEAATVRVNDIPGLSLVPAENKSAAIADKPLYENSEGKTFEYDKNENNEDEMYEMSTRKAGTIEGDVEGSYTDSAISGCGSVTCPAANPSKCGSWKFKPNHGYTPSEGDLKNISATSDGVIGEYTGRQCNCKEASDGKTYCSDYYHYGTCKYTCTGSYSKTTTAYYRKHYSTASDSENGIYEISTLSNISNRLESIKQKFIPISTLTGHYLYYITAEDGLSDFGTRACDLYVEADGSPDKTSWDDLIRYRSVELNNMFPGRSPGRNWIGYNTQYVSSKSAPMYTITLTATAMRNIARSSGISNYVNWKLPSAYRPVDEYGNYNSNGDYWSDFGGLSSINGVTINRNRAAIVSRNNELVSHGYNKYQYTIDKKEE